MEECEERMRSQRKEDKGDGGWKEKLLRKYNNNGKET